MEIAEKEIKTEENGREKHRQSLTRKKTSVKEIIYRMKNKERDTERERERERENREKRFLFEKRQCRFSFAH